MSTRRGTRAGRCPNCMVQQANCFCEQVSPIQINTRVSVIVYKVEKYLPSNTAHLVDKALSNTAKFERGHKDKHLNLSFIDAQNYHPLYLFPSDDATELSLDFLGQFDKPINLIIPDGTWRQAKKVHRRETLLKDLPRIKLSLNQKTEYQLRRQKHEFGLCTFEAIAHALQIIEGDEVFEKLMADFRVFQQAHLKGRLVYKKKKPKIGYTLPRPKKKEGD